MSRIDDLLSRVRVVAEVAAQPARVERERVDTVSRADCPLIVVTPGEGFSDPRDQIDIRTAFLDLRIHVRAEAGSAEADRLHALVHAALRSDPELSALVCSLRLQSWQYDQSPADVSSTVKRARYRVIYDIPPQDL